MSGLPVPTFEKTIEIQLTIPAGAEANSILVAQIIDDPTEGAKSSVQVPVTQAWVIEDIFAKDAPSIDFMLEVYKNGTRKMVRTPPMSTELISDNTRKKITPLGFEPGSIITIKGINLAKNGGTAPVTVTAYANVAVYGQ